jgi:hypothetical protein
MAGPIVAGVLYSVLVIVLSFLKPNAARIFLGIFFLAMGLGVNLSFLLTQPSFVYDYGKNSWLPLYRILSDTLIAPAPLMFGILLIVFEVTIGVLLLSRRGWVRVGLVGVTVFVLALIPINPIQGIWALSIVGTIYLLTRSFDTGLLGMIAKRKRRPAERCS